MNNRYTLCFLVIQLTAAPVLADTCVHQKFNACHEPASCIERFRRALHPDQPEDRKTAYRASSPRSTRTRTWSSS